MLHVQVFFYCTWVISISMSDIKNFFSFKGGPAYMYSKPLVHKGPTRAHIARERRWADARERLSHMTTHDKLVATVEWTQCYKDFDATFINSLNDFWEAHGFLTPRQKEALDKIMVKWNVLPKKTKVPCVMNRN